MGLTRRSAFTASVEIILISMLVSPSQVVRPSAHYGQGTGPIWLDDLNCTGNERDVFQCSHRGVGSHNCDHSEDVGLNCSPPTQIRLVGGGWPSVGRVEVNIGGRWGTVCGHRFGPSDAKVVCRMLGYNGSTPTSRGSSYYGRGSNLIWLDNLQCTGNETDLLQCLSSDQIGKHNCSHSDDVGVDQIGKHNCSHSDDVGVDCHVSHRKSQNPSTNGSAYYGIGSGPIWLDNVTCLGNESSIFNCKHRPLGVHGCGHLQDVGVNCRPTSGPSRVSLSGPLHHITDGTKPLTLNCTSEEFTPSVSFTWSGHSFPTNSVTSADFETLTFTPTISDDGNTAPVITDFWDGDSVMEGSNVTLTCSITGGKPTVTSVTISCGGQGRTLSSSGNQAVGGTTPSINITIDFLRAEDDGTKCQCSGNWTTQPNLYLLKSSVTIYVIRAPGFAEMSNLSTPENQPLLIELEPQTDLLKATIQLMAYPAPVLVHVAFVGPNITSDNTEHGGEEVDSNSFLLLCEASDVLYDQVCSISVLNVKVLDAGVYRLTVENMAGDFSFYVKLNVHAVTEKGKVYDNAALDSDNPRENPYVNVTAVSDSNGATGGKGRMLSEEASGGDAVYENTVLR
ncbi:hypothetical protein BaRGS_00011655 [Batillaria attramentaria]|uniref:Deleted in malignant brain tumors 1 protein-like n=1 Tax=Batillaria attramentaria TaxID=370345 RepID=A0ABD0LCU3_9CAEN